MDKVEINQIDRHFETFRLQDKNREKAILSSILEQGIREPLQCVVKPDKPLILLDGFKRLRCAVKLSLKIVPVVSIGEDEAGGILQLIRLSNEKSLNILEQAMLVDELKQAYDLSSSEIARQLERSPAWVSVRLGMIAEMGPVVKEAIFSGSFPVRSYMYTLRQFTRVNKIKRSEINSFVRAVSNKRLSSRDIDILAYGFFRGSSQMKEQIQQGNIGWTLKQLRRSNSLSISEESSFNEVEKRALLDLELTQKYMGRVSYNLNDHRLKDSLFIQAAHLLVAGILNRIDLFVKTLQEFYDQRKQEESN